MLIYRARLSSIIFATKRTISAPSSLQVTNVKAMGVVKMME